STSDNLLDWRVREGRRSRRVRPGRRRPCTPSYELCRQDPEGGPTEGFAYRAAGQIRACLQSQGGPRARAHDSAPPARPRRRGDRMRRREFIAMIGGAAAWPLAARAQQSNQTRRIGVLMGPAESDPEGQSEITAFRRGLRDLGWTGGRNVRIAYRWAGGDTDGMQIFAK